MDFASLPPIPMNAARGKQKLDEFYQKLAEHERLAASLTLEETKEDANNNSEFNPSEQDEENYEQQNDNRFYFDASSIEQVILNDLRMELLDNVSDCSFIPAYSTTK